MTVSAFRGAGAGVRRWRVDGAVDPVPDAAGPGVPGTTREHRRAGGEPITGPQRSYLETLLQRAGAAAPARPESAPGGSRARRVRALHRARRCPEGHPRGAMCLQGAPRGVFRGSATLHRARRLLSPVSR
ncbi:DUF3072 domain-containing protein [Pseudonocardia ammonioxydans]|uniref:DUF3072 domain-containing protein n=1 Tax=Pseudonocardia ammonioxydans TaxID=260086 RepID=UPI000B89F98F